VLVIVATTPNQLRGCARSAARADDEAAVREVAEHVSTSDSRAKTLRLTQSVAPAGYSTSTTPTEAMSGVVPSTVDQD